jgi:hypothetical protein
MEIVLIYFLTHLNLPARKLFYAKNIREAFGSLAYTPVVRPMGLFVNYPSFLPDLDETNIINRFSQNTQISKFMNIRPEGPSCSMQTDMKKLKVAFRNFANVSKIHSQFKQVISFFQYAVLTLGTF